MKEKLQYKYKPTREALEELKTLGYTIDFNLEKERILVNPNVFDITYIYRYEGASNPDDESSVYGIVNEETGEKGVYVLGSLGTDENIDQFIIDLEIKRKTIQDGD